jgi:NSS family neurotransmitter:Na+ symporter
VIAVALFDTLVAIAVGLAVFPLVFAHNMQPAMGPGLLFISLPHAFGNMPLGEVYGALFFLLVALVALGSCVAMLEPVVGVLRQQFGIRRITAVAVAGAAVWLLAFAALATVEIPGFTAGSGLDLFRLMDRLAGSLLLPLVALGTAVFVGWRLREVLLRAQLYRESPLFFSLWYFLLRYIAPAAIVLLLLAGLWPE